MQCINVYKKYRHGRDQADIFLSRQKKYTQICHIKIIDLAAPLYARFMSRIYVPKYM
jgi:hypothetical protein